MQVFIAGAQTVVATFNGPSTINYYHTDALGSVRAITDASGSTVQRLDYFPFGETNASLSGDPRKFIGGERDAETAFDYLGARYYRNVWGRFTSVDPIVSAGAITNPQLWNRYAYALNSPLRFSDPSGMEAEERESPHVADYGVAGFSPDELMAWVNGYVKSNSFGALFGTTESGQIPTEPPLPGPSPSDPRLVLAEGLAWMKAGNGGDPGEAFFWVFRDGSGYRAGPIMWTNERFSATLPPKPDGAVALFHTHPFHRATPQNRYNKVGDLDYFAADRLRIPVYVLSGDKGVWCMTPGIGTATVAVSP